MLRDLAATLICMAYANELFDPSALGGVPSKYTADDFSKTASANAFLSRLQLMTSNSAKCKAGEFQVNNFTLTDSTIFLDLGKEVDILVLAWRPFALDTSGDQMLSAYDVDSDIFKKIVDKADNTADSGCIHGPQFLVWVPGQKKFATLTFGSKSARKEAASVNQFMHKACTLKSKKIETKKFTWFTATGVACNTPFDMPELAAAKEQMEKFNNPPASEVEAATPTSRER